MSLDFTITTGHLITIGSFFIGALWGLVKILAVQQERRLAEKFELFQRTMQGVSDDLRREADATRVLETSFLRFQAELPRDYVRRDDFVRAVATIETRIDNFALRMERALAQGKE